MSVYEVHLGRARSFERAKSNSAKWAGWLLVPGSQFYVQIFEWVRCVCVRVYECLCK